MKTIKLTIFCSALLLTACGGNQQKKAAQDKSSINDTALLAQARAVFQPLPAVAENVSNPLSNEKIALGKFLYFDTRLSMTGKNSCNTCHNLNTFGVDNERFSEGDAGKRGVRNSPSSFNAALHFKQFWDGRAKDVEEQAGLPVMNPVEMNIPSKAFLEKRLAAVPLYKEWFKKAFPNDSKPVTYTNMTNAIGAFERILITPTKFDKFLKGETTALNETEKEGLQLFMNTGCTACHNGATIGGGQLMKFGLINDYHPLTGSAHKDNGLMDITKKEADKDIFKVASLRNVIKTQPYFHDGSVKELSKAVSVMAKAQLNKDLNEHEVTAIVTFLETLTGDIPESTKQAPKELAQK